MMTMTIMIVILKKVIFELVTMITRHDQNDMNHISQLSELELEIDNEE
jgi:hypothetical protein